MKNKIIIPASVFSLATVITIQIICSIMVNYNLLFSDMFVIFIFSMFLFEEIEIKIPKKKNKKEEK